MNTVKQNDPKPKCEYVLSDLILKNGGKETAFIGTCGTGERGLHLIAYDQIIKLDDPINSWDSLNCDVVVDEFVDVEITVIHKG